MMRRLGLTIVVFTIVAAAIGPWIVPDDPVAQNLALRLSGPSWRHLLGLDELGRDVLARLLVGARISLLVGFAVVTIIGLQFGAVLTGTIITETIFAWPGIGRLLITAINTRDYPLVQGCILFIAVTYVVMNLLVDLAYAWLDPRIRYE